VLALYRLVEAKNLTSATARDETAFRRAMPLPRSSLPPLESQHRVAADVWLPLTILILASVSGILIGIRLYTEYASLPSTEADMSAPDMSALDHLSSRGSPSIEYLAKGNVLN